MRTQLNLKSLTLQQFKSLWVFRHQLILSLLCSSTLLLFHIMLDQNFMEFPGAAFLVVFYVIARNDIDRFREAMIWESLPPRRKSDLVYSLRQAVAFPGFLFLYHFLSNDNVAHS